MAGFLSEDEKDALTISRMIFHVVGRSLVDPHLLDEITPPLHADFFLERVKSALRGNLFMFRDASVTETRIRAIAKDPKAFTAQTKLLATDFQSRHSSSTSMGVFFVFELSVGRGGSIYALIKYDNEDVVRYVLASAGTPQVPKLERFSESFVRKAEAMQKIALVRLDDAKGGRIMVKDRSNRAHISDYFEGFLQAKRVNSVGDLTSNLVEAFKDTFKAHQASLPPAVQEGGIARVFDILRQGHLFDPDDCEALVTSVFGPGASDAAVRRTLNRNLRQRGVSEETFDVLPERVQKPRRRRMETSEGVHILYDEKNRPTVVDRPDGRKEIQIVTARVTRDDVEVETKPRRGDAAAPSEPDAAASQDPSRR